MSRAGVANVSARAETLGYFAFLRSFRPKDADSAVRWAIPALLVLIITFLIVAACDFSCGEQGRAVDAATHEIELVSSLIADDVEARLREVPAMSAPAALDHALSSRVLRRGQKILLSDASGKIIASYPDRTATGTLTDHIGSGQPIAVFAEKAGVMRLSLPSGMEALASAHALREPLGQITIIHPMPDVLSDWHDTVAHTIALICLIAATLGGLALAYFWQATKMREAQSSCRSLRDRVEMVLSRVRCGLWDWDLVGGRIDWSPSMYELLGFAPKVAPMAVADVDRLIHPEDGGLDALTAALTANPNGAVDHVFRIKSADGHWLWLRAKAELVHTGDGLPHLVGIAIDVTETMALEARTAAADMRLRDAIETISEAFVVWDAENKLVISNSKFQRFHNLPDDAVVTGTPYTAVMERGTAPLIQQVALGEELPMGARTFEAQLGDGRWLQVNERRTKGGGYVSVGTDITALKRNEEQLLESERRLMSTVVDLKTSRQTLETQAQQLAELAEKYLEQKAEAESANRAKSEFLANMGHELRTPLNAVLGFSEIMMSEAFGPLGSPLYNEYCKDIHDSGQHLLEVITDVLEMSRLEAGRIHLEKSDFEIGDAIDTAMASVSAAATENAIVFRSQAARGAKLHADRTAVERILAILLNNAVKYTPLGGEVTVRTRALSGALQMSVEDTGPGIAPEAIARLGRPFEQSGKRLKNGLSGSGLGLAIARSFAELHGGSLSIRSQQGAGTVVQITLPNRLSPPTKLPPAMTAGRATTRPPRFTYPDRTVRKISRTA